ncbi:MAG: hypothetical protein GXY33_02550 [Phycisphaerae bacterium]|nr:hypothetical protein [Phycisphaerae bacterium]
MKHRSSERVLRLFEDVIALQQEDPLREGGVVCLPDYGQVVMTGDLHGFSPNLHALKHFANLERQPHRHVVLHELIHQNGQGLSDSAGEDNSLLLLLDALEWKLRHPEQVHFVLGNHDLAQITGREITKSGGASIAAFNEWIRGQYGSGAEGIAEGLIRLLLSFPLAVRCPNRLWLSHSIPGPHAMAGFDLDIFGRGWTWEDMIPGGSVYELVWGRGHTAAHVDEFAQLLGVDFFVIGHQAQDQGFQTQFQRMIILASDHGNGCFMPIDLSRRYEFDELTDRIRFFHQFVPPADPPTP